MPISAYPERPEMTQSSRSHIGDTSIHPHALWPRRMWQIAIILTIAGTSPSYAEGGPIWPDYWRDHTSPSLCSLSLWGHLVESDNGILVMNAYFAIIMASGTGAETEAHQFDAFVRNNSAVRYGELVLVLAFSGGGEAWEDSRGPINLSAPGLTSKLFESPVPFRDRPLNRFLVLPPDSNAIRTKLFEGHAIHFELTYPSGHQVKIEYREPSPLPFQQRSVKFDICTETMSQENEGR
jgi:hypothetical protein